jgi:hypothetical protein
MFMLVTGIVAALTVTAAALLAAEAVLPLSVLVTRQ